MQGKGVHLKATIQKFGSQGEKTGWTYIAIPATVAEKLKPGTRQSFRVRGMLDTTPIEKVALIPVGEGNFILPLNAALRRQLHKTKGAEVEATLFIDTNAIELPADLLACLQDEPGAEAYFMGLTMGHRNYFIKWIESAKTQATRDKRIAMTVNACVQQLDYAQMIRADKATRNALYGNR